jgi:biopolymer transport protein TolQ
METETLALAQEIDFSFWALFARATFVNKLVLVILIVASLWAWAIIIQKLIDYRRARAEAATFEEAFWSGEPLDELFERMGEAPRARPSGSSPPA